MKPAAAFFLLLYPLMVSAGGTYGTVRLVQFTTYGSDQYLLTVEPVIHSSAQVPPDFFKQCKVFSVLGGFHKQGFFEQGIFKQGYLPSKDKYLAAIKLLKTRPKTFNLGLMGGGFKRLNPDDPCLVTSRSLELIEDNESKAVISWYNNT